MNTAARKLLLCMLILSAVGLSGCGAGDGVQAQSTPSTLATKDLSAFVDTYWYVPTDYLLAYAYSSSGNPKTTAVNDQTVWHFTSVNQGFLLGCSFASTNNGATWSASTIVGSVTANNSVSIGFYGSSLTVGSGQLTTSSGQPAFLMQMSTGNGTAGLTHWAYMLPVTSSNSAWSSLPGTNSVSVPTATASGC
ncbi:hypothetical protein AOC21_02365 [Polynucleobacter sp. VK25]|uniref:hypothetical protein n=1 Tax=Polynucleobacter sp. VK25 TaxID=1758398 RepID=UPI001BFE1621|nr:hypothetical protein [Polynucleobacter sp. VK25]QWD68764.1 hypothetical protein AOC21_02365 [Polynucleobacter sp. VK25]